MTTAPSDRNPRWSRTKSLLGVLAATALLSGVVQALSPVSAAAMMKQETPEECELTGGWWENDGFGGFCVRFDETGIGGSGSDGGGGGISGSGGEAGGSEGSGGVELVLVPSDLTQLTDAQLREIANDEELMEEWREEAKRILRERNPYPEDPNVFHPINLRDPSETVTARLDRKPQKRQAKKKPRKGRSGRGRA